MKWKEGRSLAKREPLVLLLPALLFYATSVTALEIRESVWGFDGRVVPERFNPLTVLLVNPSAEPFDGVIELHKSRGLDQRVGAPQVQPCYVSGYSTRWVQFYPYVSQSDTWRLVWGRGGGEQKELADPAFGPPARVLLDDPAAPSRATSAFRSFPDDWFPTTVAALDGLEIVLLDHVPRWEPARREALLDWVHGGGVLVLLQDSAGRYPEFGDDWAALNAPLDRVRSGNGRLIRQPLTRREFTPAHLAAAGFPTRELTRGETIAVHQMSDSVLRKLVPLSRPRHAWSLIYLLTLAYLVLVGPLHYVWSKRRRNYRQSLLALALAVALFSFAFAVLGRQGQGGANSAHSIAYARALDNRTYRVTQWINLFVTRSDDYTIRHAAPHNLYATAQDFEAVNGLIVSGKEGHFTAELPLYSQRALLHQARLPGDDTGVEILAWRAAESLEEFSLGLGSGFPRETLEIWALYRDTFHAMKRSGDRLDLEEKSVAQGSPSATPARQSASQFLSAENLRMALYSAAYRRTQDRPPEEVEAEYRKLVRPLIAWSLGGNKHFHQYVTPLPGDDRVQLFILARHPESFRISGGRFSQETGYVLYHQDLWPIEPVK